MRWRRSSSRARACSSIRAPRRWSSPATSSWASAKQRFDEATSRGELGEVVLGRVQGRTSQDEITIFKSLGMAVEDVVTADLVFRTRHRDRGGHRADSMRRAHVCRALIALGLACVLRRRPARPASASSQAQRIARALIERAFDAAYNLDHAEAIALSRQGDRGRSQRSRCASRGRGRSPGCASDSCAARSPSTTISAASASRTSTWLPPPADEAQRFQRHIARALQLAEADLQRARAIPKRTSGSAPSVGTQASYGATVEGKVLASFRAARRAYDAHEKVLELDPSRKDAGLIVGTYRYIVSALSLPIRLMAYVAGFGGGKERGLQMIEEAAAYPGLTQTDAKFALLLLYNREQRYDDALRVVERPAEAVFRATGSCGTRPARR